MRLLTRIAEIARTVESVAGDWYLNINSRGGVTFPSDRGAYKDAANFETVAHLAILKAIRLAKLRSEDVVVVLGAGKGRAVCHFARRQVKKVVGIEISSDLCKVVEANVTGLRQRRAQVEIANADAVEADLSTGSIFFMFNPFGPDTLRQVLSKIEASPQRDAVRIIYMNAYHRKVFEDFPWLQLKSSYKRYRGQQVLIYVGTRVHRK